MESSPLSTEERVPSPPLLGGGIETSKVNWSEVTGWAVVRFCKVKWRGGREGSGWGKGEGRKRELVLSLQVLRMIHELFCLVCDDAFRVCIPDSLQKTACPFSPNWLKPGAGISVLSSEWQNFNPILLLRWCFSPFYNHSQLTAVSSLYLSFEEHTG